MKVGTDAILWASFVAEFIDYSINNSDYIIIPKPSNILDVGSGCGILSLCMAQVFEKALVTAIDIDKPSIEEAAKNFQSSQFVERMQAKLISLQDFAQTISKYPFCNNIHYDLIISNPPFFTSSFLSPDIRRTNARHNNTLPLQDFVLSCKKIMSKKSHICVILPMEESEKLKALFANENVLPLQIINVYPKPAAKVKRQVIIYTNYLGVKPIQKDFFIRDDSNMYTQQYKELVSLFLL